MQGAKSSQPVIRTRYDVVCDALLVTEGGLVDNPADPGGITKYGISLRFLAAEWAIRGHDVLLDVNRDGKIDGLDIRALTPDVAKPIYRKSFWDAYGLAQLAPPLDGLMLDQCVNMGPRVAIRLLQDAVGGLLLDGKLGPVTDAAIAARASTIGMPALVAAYKVKAKSHYAVIIAHNPELARFRTGWNNRVDRLGLV